MWTAAGAALLTVYMSMSFWFLKYMKLPSQEKKAHVENLKQEKRYLRKKNRDVRKEVEMGRVLQIALVSSESKE